MNGGSEQLKGRSWANLVVLPGWRVRSRAEENKTIGQLVEKTSRSSSRGAWAPKMKRG